MFGLHKTKMGVSYTMKLRIVQAGILYRNPHPDHRAIQATSPNVVPLSESELLCLYRVGQALYSDDSTVARLRSTDGGTTWTEEGLVWDPRNEDVPHIYSGPLGTALADGTLLVIGQRLPRSSDEYSLRFNPATGGVKPFDIFLQRSQDRGHTWSEPEVLDLRGAGIVDAPSSIIELNDGRWFLACERWKAWDDPSPLHIKGFAMFSADKGKTWGDRMDFPWASDTAKMYHHSRAARKLDGRICALQRTQSIGGREDYDLHFVESDETGRKWSPPRPSGVPGQNNSLADLGSGTLVAVSNAVDTDKPGVLAVLSEDEGKTWDLANRVMLWSGNQHTRVHAVRLIGGDVMCSWWVYEDCVATMRYAQVTVQ